MEPVPNSVTIAVGSGTGVGSTVVAAGTSVAANTTSLAGASAAGAAHAVTRRKVDDKTNKTRKSLRMFFNSNFIYKNNQFCHTQKLRQKGLLL
jgi:hypothetical protein